MTTRFTDTPVLTRVTYGLDDGFIRSAAIELDENAIPPNLRRELLRAVARTLGFESAENVPSVLNDPSGDDLDDLTSEDRAAYCAKYGVCG